MDRKLHSWEHKIHTIFSFLSKTTCRNEKMIKVVGATKKPNTRPDITSSQPPWLALATNYCKIKKALSPHL
jgi:hypothetical protein